MWIKCALILALGIQEQRGPLPDAEAFRSSLPAIIYVMNNSFRWALFHNDLILNANEYNYTENETSVIQDSPAAIETKTYTIVRGPESWQSYRKQISRNGSPLTDLEKQEQERNHERLENNVRAAVAKTESQPDSAKNAAVEKRRREGEATNKDLTAMFEIRVIGKERIENVPVVLLEIKKKPGYKPKTEGGDLWRNFAMRAWVTETDREVVRLTATIGEAFDEGRVVLEKGATLSFERRLINGEVWLPTRIELNNLRARTGSRLGARQHVISEFSDFKKFTVDTVIRSIAPQEF